ncbi:MAG TPA: glucose-6-phosphate dehydrogenase [Steroidobacteraceae bacterium]|nr:glucose-6-phosphate dehydrogenase [Steroidobacteraceae bacterium]
MEKLDSFDMVLFGGTGDLALRKLVPALYRRHVAGQMGLDSRVLAVARTRLTREEYLAQIEASCRKYLEAEEFTDARWRAFATQVEYVQVDATESRDFRKLQESLVGRDDAVRVIFLSTAPSLFTLACDNLASAGIVTPKSRVVLEKPLGVDRASAELINRSVGAIFAERQIYRIDHYLGKETVQNLMALRFGNTLFEPLWRRGRVRHVQITIAEQLGVEGRGQFYEHTGALRDMVQNHLLQLVCILAMEPPASSDPDAVRDEKLKVLRALRPIAGNAVEQKTVRGQYRAGAVNGQPVPGYLDESGVAADSTTETFVALKAEIDTWRWAGVPFYLRTGKRLQERITEIAVTFEDVPHSIFDGAGAKGSVANRLVIRLQPQESITLTILAKVPGETMRLKPVDLSLDLAGTFKEQRLDAYERLLMDVVKGNLTLFMRRDELDAAWRWIDPIREGWAQHDGRIKSYVAGSWGPAASSALISRDGFAWHDEI